MTRTIRQALAFVPCAIVCVVHLGSQLAGAGGVEAFTKPLLMPMLLLGLVISLPTLRSGIALFASLGILFSWAGDVFLQTPGDGGFPVGLGCFAIILPNVVGQGLIAWGAIGAAWGMGPTSSAVDRAAVSTSA